MASYNLVPLETLKKRAELAVSKLKRCGICPRRCKVNRLEDELGYCKSGRHPVISSCTPHFGEEPPLVGTHGSGAIFMTNCNLRCVFCQNYDISQLGEGTKVSPKKMATMMIRLQDKGCHNINFVTPTHFVPQILEAVVEARIMGLCIPLVYNCGGYESAETIQLLEGIFDIYMPDVKYGSDENALKYSDAPNYTKYMKAAILEMYRQVGDLVIEKGIARRGILVRHLVLPNNLAGTAEVIKFLAQEISPNTYLNVMSQYHPSYKAHQFPDLNRPISLEEHSQMVRLAQKFGLTRGLEI